MKWVVGLAESGPPELMRLYQRALICKTFPAYTFELLDTVSAPRLLKALTLLNLVEKAQSQG